MLYWRLYSLHWSGVLQRLPSTLKSTTSYCIRQELEYVLTKSLTAPQTEHWRLYPSSGAGISTGDGGAQHSQPPGRAPATAGQAGGRRGRHCFRPGNCVTLQVHTFIITDEWCRYHFIIWQLTWDIWSHWEFCLGPEQTRLRQNWRTA